jgi:hypothetical protein
VVSEALIVVQGLKSVCFERPSNHVFSEALKTLVVTVSNTLEKYVHQ